MPNPTIYLTSEELTAIEEIADETDSSRSAIIRDAIRESPPLRGAIRAEEAE